MASSPISPTRALENVSCAYRAQRLLEYWHLLSLDAPTVAVTWSWAFAHATGTVFPLLSALTLGLATWLLYVADRLLDGIRPSHTASLRERHHFHARHRTAFIALAVPCACLLVWIALAGLDRALRSADLRLGACAGIYLLCVHLPRRCLGPFRFPKELAVAIVFATACVMPAWSLQSAEDIWLLLVGVMFGLLCWLNCVAIEDWEDCGRLGKGLYVACAVLSLSALSMTLCAVVAGRWNYAVVAFCIAASALLLRSLERARHCLTPLRLRASADAVLLTPLLMLLFRHPR